jgi:calcineurin-like phosphoesterase
MNKERVPFLALFASEASDEKTALDIRYDDDEQISFVITNGVRIPVAEFNRLQVGTRTFTEQGEVSDEDAQMSETELSTRTKTAIANESSDQDHHSRCEWLGTETCTRSVGEASDADVA